MPYVTIPEAIETLRSGGMVIVVDDPDRENEGDLIVAGEMCTHKAINFMVRFGRGVPFISTTPERLTELRVPMMTERNTARHGTAMGVNVDAAHGTTTGVSAFDRAKAVQVFCDPHAQPSDLLRPGHMLTLRAEPGGVLKRSGHTEAAVDLCRLADMKPVAVGCEILAEDGTMLRMDGLVPFAEEHGLGIITIADLIAYRRMHERLVEMDAGPIDFPTRFGHFQLYAYESTLDGQPYVALVMGEVAGSDPVMVRMHSSCVTGDLLNSLRCDCGDQLTMALEKIQDEGKGILVYIPHEGRGIGLLNKLKAYALQDNGLDTVEANQALGFKADLRDYGLGAQVLADLGVKKLRLMTNNPSKIAGIQGYGLEVVEHVPLIAEPRGERKKYLQTKREKLGHRLP